MNKTMYTVRKYSRAGEIEIGKVDISEETKYSYQLTNGTKLSKNYYTFHNTFEEAQKELADLIEEKIRLTLEALEDHRKDLVRIKTLTEESLRKT